MTTTTPHRDARIKADTKGMIEQKNALDFVPLDLKEYTDYIEAMNSKKREAYAAWHSQQEQRRLEASRIDDKIRVMLKALGKLEEDKNGGLNDSHCVLWFAYGWTKAGGDAFKFHDMLASALEQYEFDYTKEPSA